MWRLIDPKHPMYDAALAAKYGDSIERVYKHADDFVGEVVKRVGPDVPVMIVSDHGFHSWRKAVNLDTWLVQNGYMVLKGQPGADKKLADLFGGGTFWENVDWSRTRAYAMGIGQIYFNLRGRESQGIVSPGAEAEGARRRARGQAPDDDRSRGWDAHHPRGLQARRHLQRPVSRQRRRIAGRHGRGLSRLVADHSWADRRRASSTRTTGSGAPITAATTTRSPRASWSVEPADRGGRAADHRPRPDRAALLRPGGAVGYRRQAAVLTGTMQGPMTRPRHGVDRPDRAGRADPAGRTAATRRRTGVALALLGSLLGAAAVGARLRPIVAAPDALAQRAAERLAGSRRKPKASPARNRRCSSTSGSSRSSARSRPDSSMKSIARPGRLQQQLAAAGTRAAGAASDAAVSVPTSTRGWCSSTRWGAPATGGCSSTCSNLRDLGRAYRTAAALGRIDRDRIDEHRRTLASLSAERTRLEQRSRQLQPLRARAQDARLAADRAVRRTRRWSPQSTPRRDLNAQLTGELQDAQQKLQATVGRVRGAAAVCRSVRSRAPCRGRPKASLPSRVRPRRGGPPACRGPASRLSLAEGQPVRAVHEGPVAYADPSPATATWSSSITEIRPIPCMGTWPRSQVRKGDRVEAGKPSG